MDDSTAFYVRSSLNVATYDSQADAVIAGDIPFYLELAESTPGPILDLGGGTGRVGWPLAEAGHEVTTLELSSAMLAVSRAKATTRDAAVAARVAFVEADMRDFELGDEFGLAIAPFRVFQLLHYGACGPATSERGFASCLANPPDNTDETAQRPTRDDGAVKFRAAPRPTPATALADPFAGRYLLDWGRPLDRGRLWVSLPRMFPRSRLPSSWISVVAEWAGACWPP